MFGKTAFCVDAIDDALRMANGLLPVRVDPDPVPTKLFVPEDLSLSLIIFFESELFSLTFYFFLFKLDPLLFELDFELELVDELLPLLGGPRMLISGYRKASNLNCSML